MYSIVIPIYNEHETIPELHRRLNEVMNSLDESSEVIFVDDGSVDNSFQLLNDIHTKDPRFKVSAVFQKFRTPDGNQRRYRSCFR